MLGLVVNSIFSTKLAALFHIILCSPVHVAAPIISLLGGAYEWQAKEVLRIVPLQKRLEEGGEEEEGRCGEKPGMSPVV